MIDGSWSYKALPRKSAWRNAELNDQWRHTEEAREWDIHLLKLYKYLFKVIFLKTGHQFFSINSCFLFTNEHSSFVSMIFQYTNKERMQVKWKDVNQEEQKEPGWMIYSERIGNIVQAPSVEPHFSWSKCRTGFWKTMWKSSMSGLVIIAEMAANLSIKIYYQGLGHQNMYLWRGGKLIL